MPIDCLREVFHAISHIDVDTVKRENALLELVRSPDVPCAFHRIALESKTILRAGDILVGFVARESTSLDVTICDKVVCNRHSLSKGEFVYALDDQFVIPLISLRFHEVKVSSFEHLDAIYCLMNTEQRRTMALNSWYSFPVGPGDGMYLLYESGMCTPSLQMPPVGKGKTLFELPSVGRKRDFVAESKERTAILLKDLSEKTWEPSRMRRWCLSHEDEFAITLIGADESASKIWLGDVLLMDHFVLPDAALEFAWNRDVRLRNDEGASAYLSAIQTELVRHGITNIVVVGDRIVCGSYGEGEGLHSHRDGSLQGGDLTLIVYLNDVEEGGCIVFDDCGVKIRPKKHRCIIFSVDKLHHVEPVTRGRRCIIGCECALASTAGPTGVGV
jgi:hypothetical protein